MFEEGEGRKTSSIMEELLFPKVNSFFLHKNFQLDFGGGKAEEG